MEIIAQARRAARTDVASALEVLEMLKTLATLLFLICLGTSSAAATYRFDISGFSPSSSAFGALDLDPTTSATLQVTFADTPSRSARTIDTSDFLLQDTQYAILSYRYEIGDLVLSSDTLVPNSEVFVRDGVESRDRTTFDYFQVTIRLQTALGNGSQVSVIQAQFPGNGLNDWSGLDVPSPATLNGVRAPSSFIQVVSPAGQLTSAFGRNIVVSSVDTPAVPLPSSLPLLLVALLSAFAVSRRRI